MRDETDHYVHSYDFHSRRKNLNPKREPYDLDMVHVYDGDEKARKRYIRAKEKDARRYSNTIRKSIAINASRRDYRGDRRTPKTGFFKNAMSTFISIALVGAIGYPVIKHTGITDIFHNNQTMERILEDYYTVVTQAITGRNADNTAPEYDYEQIAQHIVDSGNVDEGLYGVYEAFEMIADRGDYIALGPNGESYTDVEHSSLYASEEMNNVIRHISDSHSIDDNSSWEDYLKARGFKDEDDWKKYVREVVKKENEISELHAETLEKDDELSEMYDDHQYTDNDENSVGGRSI